MLRAISNTTVVGPGSFKTSEAVFLMTAAAATMLRRSSRIAALSSTSTAKARSGVEKVVSARAVVGAAGRRKREVKTPGKDLLAAPSSTSSGTSGSDSTEKKPPSLEAAAKAPAKSKAKKTSAGPSRQEEEALWSQGYRLVAGTDEAGRGPLAGPVVAAACCIPPGVEIEGVADSKKLTEAKREEIYATLTSHPDILWAAHVVEAPVIDEINILQAAMLAMDKAVEKLPTPPDYVLVDGNRLPKGLDPDRAHFVIKGDDKVYAIAAASIIAKVTRDRLMLEYDKTWPQYDLKNNKGYGTAKHLEAIRKVGATRIHRRTFAPIKHMDLPPLDKEE